MSTLLITGANRGIGLELCRQYLAADWLVHACCRKPENASQLLSLQQANQNKLVIHSLDVRHIDQLENLQRSLKKIPIDLLLNNAGIHAIGASEFGNCDDDVWQEAVQVNLLAPMKMMEYFVDNVARSEMKTIANITSKMGSMADNSSGGSYAYRATKAALNAVTVSAAQDLKYRKVKVLLLHPGWVRTDMGGPYGELTVEQSASMLLTLMNNADMRSSGKFIDIDGTEIPW